MKKVLGFIVMSIILLIMIISITYSSEFITIYDYSVSIETPAISFIGTELDNVDSIIANLQKLPKLEKVSLGSYDVHVTDEAKLYEAYPDIDFTLNAFVTMYGTNYYTTDTSLDLSESGVKDITDLYDNLSYMKDISYVTLGETTIPIEDRDKLESQYPNVKFDIIATYDVYGQTIREDATKINLSKAKIDSNLSDYLALFKNLEYVDLHKQDLSIEKKTELMNQFPNIDFAWEIKFLDETYESTITELDLTNIYMVNRLDELREVIPYFKDLTFINMSNCSVDNETMAGLRDEYPNIKIVWKIYLGTRWALRTDQVAFSVLIYTYNYRQMVTADIEVLKYCTDLQALDLGHQDIADLTVIGEYLTELRVLILADNALTDLSPLANLKHLHYLEFFVNNVTDLTPLASCTQLVDLNISYNHSLSDITPILNLPKLERLWLEHCNVSEADIHKLEETYPDATIIAYGKGSIDQGWRTHDRYFAMIDMFMNNKWTMSEEFSKYD